MLEQIVQKAFGLGNGSARTHHWLHDPEQLKRVAPRDFPATLGVLIAADLHMEDPGEIASFLLCLFGAPLAPEWVSRLAELDIAQRQALMFVLWRTQQQMRCCEESIPRWVETLLDTRELKSLIDEHFSTAPPPPSEPYFLTEWGEVVRTEVRFEDEELLFLLPDAFVYFLPAYMQRALDDMLEQGDDFEKRQAEAEWRYRFFTAMDARVRAFRPPQKRVIRVFLRHLHLIGNLTHPPRPVVYDRDTCAVEWFVAAELALREP